MYLFLLRKSGRLLPCHTTFSKHWYVYVLFSSPRNCHAHSTSKTLTYKQPKTREMTRVVSAWEGGITMHWLLEICLSHLTCAVSNIGLTIQLRETGGKPWKYSLSLRGMEDCPLLYNSSYFKRNADLSNLQSILSIVHFSLHSVSDQ